MNRKLLALACVLATIIGLGWWFAQHVTLDQLIAYENELRSWSEQRWALALVAAFFVYALVSFVPGTTGKSLVCGWLFGFWLGTALVNVALTATAICSFLLARHLLRDAIQSRWGYYLQRIDQAIDRDGAFYVFTLRLLHFPYTFINYAMGATSLRLRDFWWASQLGMLPGNLLFVYTGAQLPTLQQLSDEGPFAALTTELVAALILLGIFPLLTRAVLRRFRGPLSISWDGDS